VVLVALPLLAILVSTAFATLGNRERERDETDVPCHFEFVSDLEELSLLIVDAETVRVGSEASSATHDRLQKGKQLMDALRIELRLMRSGEKRLLVKRES